MSGSGTFGASDLGLLLGSADALPTTADSRGVGTRLAQLGGPSASTAAGGRAGQRDETEGVAELTAAQAAELVRTRHGGGKRDAGKMVKRHRRADEEQGLDVDDEGGLRYDDEAVADPFGTGRGGVGGLLPPARKRKKKKKKVLQYKMMAAELTAEQQQIQMQQEEGQGHKVPPHIAPDHVDPPLQYQQHQKQRFDSHGTSSSGLDVPVQQHDMRRQGGGRDEDDEEDEFVSSARKARPPQRKKAEAIVLSRRRGRDDVDDVDRRRRRSSSSCSGGSSSDTSSSSAGHERGRRRRDRRHRRRQSRSSSDPSSSSDDLVSSSRFSRRRHRARQQTRKRSSSSTSSGSDDSRRRGRHEENRSRGQFSAYRRRSRSRSRSSSGSSSEDDVAARRRRAREKAAQRQQQQQDREAGAESLEERFEDRRGAPVENGTMEMERKRREETSVEPLRRPGTGNGKEGRRKRSSSTSSASSTGSNTSSSSSSTSSSSDGEVNAATLVAKPLFVPKHRRKAVSELAAQAEAEEAERAAKAQQIKEKRIMQSRALVAQVVAESGDGAGRDEDNGMGGPIGLQNEFDDSGGSAQPPPDDADDNLKEGEMGRRRDAWEVRELLRILRGYEEREAEEREAAELARRRNMTDEERLQEDIASGRYRKPGEQRKNKSDNERKEGMRFYHRGAFYMDEDTLMEAGHDDVRHKAAEYARTATGDEKIDRSEMPEIMKVKKFGFAGLTRYKGLAKEDTTERGRDYLPVARRT